MDVAGALGRRVDALTAFGAAFALVFVAEIGDKSQLVVLAQASRAHPARVLAEAVAAFLLLSALAVTVGTLVARAVPEWVVALVSGALFVLFGVLAAVEARHPKPAKERGAGTTFALIAVAELGDKTQVATAALAASAGHAVAVGLGAWAAMSVGALLMVAAGAWLQARVKPKARAIGTAVAFLLAGVGTLGWAAWLATR